MPETNSPIRTLIIHRADDRDSKRRIEDDVTELWSLIQTLGNMDVMDLIVQKTDPHPGTYIGPGKAAEIAGYLKENPVDVVLLSGTATPEQKFKLTKMYWEINTKIEVWDRVDLILAIFSRHAATKEAKLQIELARMKHMGPRIFGMGMILSRQGGGIGTRGIGETNTELMHRHWKREMKRVSDELAKLAGARGRQMERRREQGTRTVSLVGYTNAGKTSLFNALTGKTKLVENALFATLDSAVGQMYLPALGREVFVSDTIGFIRDLPPDLIDAFKSTLMESVHADVVLHVVDIGDQMREEKIDVVNDILTRLDIPDDKVIMVFNKTDSVLRDALEDTARIFGNTAAFISAKTATGIEDLKNAISGKLSNGIPGDTGNKKPA